MRFLHSALHKKLDNSIRICYTIKTLKYVPVAQLDRASASGAEGRAFESPQARLCSDRLGNPL